MAYTKRRAGAPPGFFEVEAAGLRWLAAAGGVRVAEVLEVLPEALTVGRISSVVPTRAAAASFGEALARTHGAGAPAFGAGPEGWTGDGYIGEAPLPLQPTERWGVFYAQQRLLPYARTAYRAGSLSSAEFAIVQRLAERLQAGDFDDGTPPARIHGDLWDGNVLWSADGVVLIDPAAHGGHRITDLAMLALFGTPHLGTVLDAYEAGAGLPEGWRSLLPLHQVHPLLVHAQLFGGGYGRRAAAAAQRYL